LKNGWCSSNSGMHAQYYSTVSPVRVFSVSHAPSYIEPSVVNCSHVFVFYFMMPSVDKILASMVDEWNMSMDHWYWQWKTQVLGKKPLPVPLCLPKIPYGLACYQTSTSKMRGQEATAWP
jgi:hypothetical protein